MGSQKTSINPQKEEKKINYLEQYRHCKEILPNKFFDLRYILIASPNESQDKSNRPTGWAGRGQAQLPTGTWLFFDYILLHYID